MLPIPWWEKIADIEWPNWGKGKGILLKSKGKFLFRKEIYIEHQNILTAIHHQNWPVNLPTGSRQGRLLLDPLNMNYTLLWKSFPNTNGTVFYSQVTLSITNIITYHQLSTTSSNATEVAQRAAPNCSLPEPATDNDVRDGGSKWLAVTPHFLQGNTSWAPLAHANARYKSRV